MNDQCTEKQIKKLCQSYSKQTEKEFKNYYDQDFLEWLEKTNPTELTKNKRVYTYIETSKFAQAIMDAYMSSMNDLSKKLNDQVSKNSYTKEEVIELVFEAFDAAKLAGESQIKNIK
ncbi:MAG: hypothetical protein ACJ0A4_07145 [Paracoccaceae bacterium]